MIKLVEPAIYELLKTLAGGRVYALRAEQNTPTPFVIFNRTGSDRWRAINGPSGIAQAYVQVDAYGADYYEAKELAAEILVEGGDPRIAKAIVERYENYKESS